MIAFIKGKLDLVGKGYVIIDNHGIGYEVHVSMRTIEDISGKAEIKLYTYLQPSEDSLKLYGFYTKEELSMFHLLKSVTGIGPKSAIAILSAASPANIMLYIVSEDTKAMSALPGIGKKTAGRIFLELKDKINMADAADSFSDNTQSVSETGQSNQTLAVKALVELGYGRSEALKTVMDVYEEHMETEAILKLALKKFVSSK